MGLYRTSLPLVDVAQGNASSQPLNGNAKSIRPSEVDGVKDTEQGFAVYYNLTAVGGTNPTLDAKLQTSFDDGATWVDVANAAMTQKQGAGAQTQTVAIPAASVIGPKVRAVVTPGGDAAPTAYGTVLLLSNGGLQT